MKKGLLLLTVILISMVTFAQEKDTGNQLAENVSSSSEVNNLLDFKVYPNPTQHSLTVNIGKPNGGISFQINDVLGKLVYNRKIVSHDLQKGNFKLDMSSFKEGIYMFSVKTKTFSKTIKVVKL